MTLTCPPQADVSAYVDGELAASECAAFEGHLQGCPACSRRVNEMRALQVAFRALGDPAPGFDLRPLIEDRLRQPGRQAPRFPRRLAPPRLAGALATLGSLAGGLALGLSLAVAPTPLPPARPAAMARTVAKGVLAREAKMHVKIRPGPADASVFGSQDGPSIAEEMSKEGLIWVSAGQGNVKSRTAGWDIMRRMIEAAIEEPREGPGLFVMDTCRQFLRTIPLLPRDTHDPDDVDTNAEDHVADEVRYRCAFKPYTYRVRRLPV